MEVLPSALKHGWAEEDILHAWRQVLRYEEIQAGGETRLLAIGPSRDGTILELVAVEYDQPSRIIHAMVCRPKFLALLQQVPRR